MVKLLVVGVVAAVAFIVFSVIDCATMPRVRVRSLNKPVWVLLVIVLPVLGAVLWFILGRAPASGEARQSRYRGPEDDPDFGAAAPRRPTRSASEKEHDDATLRQLEEQLRDGDDDGKRPGAK
jgi:hypothetical protein